METSRRISIILCLCLLLSSLSACTVVSRQEAIEKVHNDTAAPEQSAAAPTEEQPQEPSAPAKEKTVLKLAGVGCSESKIKMVINEFNKTDSDYMVSLTDYGVTGTAEQGKMKLQAQMMAGKAPDMLLFDEEVFRTSGDPSLPLSPLAYISNEMLLDLDKFVQTDMSLSENDFIIWDALHEFGGMYVVGPKFEVKALCCLPVVAEQYRNWTLDDYYALQETMTGKQKLLYNVSPESFIQMIGRRYIHTLVDVTQATCDFVNPDFVKFLEEARNIETYNAEVDHMQEDMSFKSAPEMLMDGELIFYGATLDSATEVAFNRFNTGVRIWYGEGENPYRENGRLKAIKTPLGYTGYPTPDGKNGMQVNLPYAVGICAGTEKAEGCWEFIKYMLEHPMYQDMWDGTPVLESLLDENLASINTYEEPNPWVTTKADQDALVAAARRCQIMSYYDVDVLGIITEEAAEFLAGKKTAEDAAKMIQNRASVLVMEQYG